MRFKTGIDADLVEEGDGIFDCATEISLETGEKKGDKSQPAWRVICSRFNVDSFRIQA